MTLKMKNNHLLKCLLATCVIGAMSQLTHANIVNGFAEFWDTIYYIFCSGKKDRWFVCHEFEPLEFDRNRTNVFYLCGFVPICASPHRIDIVHKYVEGGRYTYGIRSSESVLLKVCVFHNGKLFSEHVQTNASILVAQSPSMSFPRGVETVSWNIGTVDVPRLPWHYKDPIVVTVELLKPMSPTDLCYGKGEIVIYADVPLR